MLFLARCVRFAFLCFSFQFACLLVLVIAEEKQHQEFISGISSFKRQSLKRTVSQEKYILPDRQSTLVFCF